ncbi:MAG TPA: cytochrome c oxidase subunit 3 [Mycobacterium sp.]|jgi:heme/copper-type cytochrome/quinol oxidase subunit 3|nr:cytochrome c oxidase subunit 3 [Mycobacterium sp.]
MSDHALAVERRAVQQTSNAVLGMLLFVISESMFFMGFIAVYFTAYSAAIVWPPKAFPIPSMGLPTAAVIVLIFSVATMTMAARAGRRRAHRLLVRWTAATLALATAFAVLLGLSYHGVGIHANTGIYGSLFWVLSVVALAHVIGGIVFFVLVLTQATAGELQLRQDPLQAASIYWNFVAVIGIALYAIFYLANVGAK